MVEKKMGHEEENVHLKAEIERLKAAHGNSEIAQLADAIIGRTPKAQDPLDMMGVSEGRKNIMRGLQADGSPRVAPRWRDIECVSPITGASILVHVVESKTFKHGRITGFSRYRHPAKAYLHEDAGGLVPNGLKIYKADSSPYVPEGTEPAKESLTIEFLEWRWKEYAQKDQLNFGSKNRREFLPSYCATPDGIDTSWRPGTIAALDEANA